jgi:ABC-type glycerol-3-phosphate transport system permease component
VIYINSRENWTLPLGLAFLRRMNVGDLGSTDMELVMAASIVVMLPCLLVFFFAQKHFIQGIVFHGIKG